MHVIDINSLCNLGADFQGMNIHPEHLNTAPEPYQEEYTLSQPPQLFLTARHDVTCPWVFDQGLSG